MEIQDGKNKSTLKKHGRWFEKNKSIAGKKEMGKGFIEEMVKGGSTITEKSSNWPR